jgi:molybdopterin converting factor small subunit
MGPDDRDTAAPETEVLVRYWASARSAAGVAEESFPGPVTLAGLVDAALARHPDAPTLGRVLQVCSVLVDGVPVRSRAPEEVTVHPGASVEFLPPFAGG